MNADVFHVFELHGVWKFNMAVIDYDDFHEYKKYNPNDIFEFFDRFNIDEEDIEEIISGENTFYSGIHKIKK